VLAILIDTLSSYANAEREVFYVHFLVDESTVHFCSRFFCERVFLNGSESCIILSEGS
jgi:hypothetical protein